MLIRGKPEARAIGELGRSLLLSQVTLGDVDGDNRCVVSAGGRVSSGGTGPLSPPRADTQVLLRRLAQ
jgi:hypothetical protein